LQHIYQRDYSTAIVSTSEIAVRAMRREDLKAMRAWGRHTDPLFTAYNVPALTEAECDAYWSVLSARPRTRQYAGLLDGTFAVHAIVRKIDPTFGSADLGFSSDPRVIGRGVGRRVIVELGRQLAADGFRTLTLDVAGYNLRAIAAYRAAGFHQTALRRLSADDSIDYAGLLASESHGWLREHLELRAGIPRVDIHTMEMRLDAESEGQ